MCFEGRNGVWQYSWRGCESNGQEDERVAIVGNQAFMMHSVPFVMGLLFYILSCNADWYIVDWCYELHDKREKFLSVFCFFCPISLPHPSIRAHLVFALCIEILLLRPVLTNDNWKWLICSQVSPSTWWMVNCAPSLIILWNSWFQRFETGTVPLWSILVAHCFAQTCIVLYVLFVMHSIWIWCFKWQSSLIHNEEFCW